MICLLPRWAARSSPASIRWVAPAERRRASCRDALQSALDRHCARRFQVLAAKGFIVSRQKVGTSVRPKSAWNMLDPDFLAWHLRAALTEEFVADLFQLRQMVEPQAAYLAAQSRDFEAIERIKSAYADMDRWKTGRGDLTGADLRFHQGILDATGNLFIGALGGLIHTAFSIGTFKLGWSDAVIKEDRLFSSTGSCWTRLRRGRRKQRASAWLYCCRIRSTTCAARSIKKRAATSGVARMRG